MTAVSGAERTHALGLVDHGLEIHVARLEIRRCGVCDIGGKHLVALRTHLERSCVQVQIFTNALHPQLLFNSLEKLYFFQSKFQIRRHLPGLNSGNNLIAA